MLVKLSYSMSSNAHIFALLSYSLSSHLISSEAREKKKIPPAIFFLTFVLAVIYYDPGVSPN
jgi:hypothetical protein